MQDARLFKGGYSMKTEANRSVCSTHPMYQPMLSVMSANDCLQLAHDLQSANLSLNAKYDSSFIAEQLVVAAHYHVQQAEVILQSSTDKSS